MTPPTPTSPPAPTLLLGTAMWGWTVTPDMAFALLDQFYAAGFRWIDTATNYPINKRPEDFRRAENILLDWIKVREVSDLQIIVKIGSLNNLRSPEHNLSQSFLLMNLDDYRFRFGSNLAMLMVHWDNRDQPTEIRATFEAFQAFRAQGLGIGLSGIRHPELYAQLNEEFKFDFQIQIKHNLLQSDYQKYTAFHKQKRFLAYGINAGGIKLNPNEYQPSSSLQARGGDTSIAHPMAAPLRQILHEANRHVSRPPLLSMNHLGMLFAWYSPDMAGIIAGPSTTTQLQDTINFYNNLLQFDYNDVFEQLQRINY